MDALSRRTAGPREWEALERSGWGRKPFLTLLEIEAGANPPTTHAACPKCGAYKAWASACGHCESGMR